MVYEEAIRYAVRVLWSVHGKEKSSVVPGQMSLYDERAESSDEGPAELITREILRASPAEHSHGQDECTNFLAVAGLIAAECIHRSHKRTPANVRLCSSDLRVAGDLIVVLGVLACRLEFDEPIISDELLELLTKSVAPDPQNLADRLYVINRPHKNARRIELPSPGRPIVQINAPITAMSPTEFARIRLMTRPIKNLYQTQFCIDCTSDYINPLSVLDCDEARTRSAIYRTSAMIVFAENGKIGTGRTLEIALQLSIPTLVLNRGSEPVAKRFGDLFGETVNYVSQADVLREVKKFLRKRDIHIYNRAAKIAGYAATNTDVGARLHVAAKNWPADSTFTLEQALWWSDPIHWFQATDLVRDEILADLEQVNFVDNREAAFSPGGPPQEKRVSKRSYTNLNAYQRQTGISNSRKARLWRYYLSERLADVPFHASKRDFTLSWDTKDWEGLDQFLDGRGRD